MHSKLHSYGFSSHFFISIQSTSIHQISEINAHHITSDLHILIEHSSKVNFQYSFPNLFPVLYICNIEYTGYTSRWIDKRILDELEDHRRTSNWWSWRLNIVRLSPWNPWGLGWCCRMYLELIPYLRVKKRSTCKYRGHFPIGR